MYYILLVLFGVLGASFRYAIQLWLTMDFPLATLVVNIAGSFLLAFLTQFLSAFSYIPKKLVSAIGTGFVGSFTTFSSFALESAELLRFSDYVGAAGYMIISLIGGLFACLLGFRTSAMVLNVQEKRG